MFKFYEPRGTVSSFPFEETLRQAMSDKKTITMKENICMIKLTTMETDEKLVYQHRI